MHNQKTLAELIEIKIRENRPGSPCLLAVPPETIGIEHSPAKYGANSETGTYTKSDATDDPFGLGETSALDDNSAMDETSSFGETASQSLEPATQDSKFIHFPPNFNTSWPQTRTNQIINVIYFGTSAAMFQWLSINIPGVVSPVFAPTLLILAALSSLFLVKYRTFVSTDDELPRWTQDALRKLALLFPTFAFCGMVLMSSTTGVPVAYQHHNLPAPSAELIEPAIPIGPVNEAARDREVKIGETLLNQKQYRKAIVHFDKALSMDPKCEWALTRLAECWYEGDRLKPEKSIEYGNRVIAINPKSLDAHYYLARSYNVLHRYSLAVPHAQFITTEVPDSGPNWSVLVKAELGAGHLNAALKAANAHVKLHPNEWASLSERAGVFKAMGRTKEEQADRERLKTM